MTILWDVFCGQCMDECSYQDSSAIDPSERYDAEAPTVECRSCPRCAGCGERLLEHAVGDRGLRPGEEVRLVQASGRSIVFGPDCASEAEAERTTNRRRLRLVGAR